MKYVLAMLLLYTMGCDVEKASVEPKEVYESKTSKAFTYKVKRLNYKIQAVDVDHVKNNLNNYEKIKFQKRFDELKQEMNVVVEKVNSGNIDNEIALNNQYAKTKTMWDYLVNNFNI